MNTSADHQNTPAAFLGYLTQNAQAVHVGSKHRDNNRPFGLFDLAKHRFGDTRFAPRDPFAIYVGRIAK